MSNQFTHDAAVDRLGITRLNLKPGDCFAYDGPGYVDGDIMYVEVLELIPRFSDQVDRVGKAVGGYRVAVYCFDEEVQRPSRAEDFYAWDFVDEKCVRLDAAEMSRARDAGWPLTYVHFREVFGNELALLDWLGVPVGSQGREP